MGKAILYFALLVSIKSFAQVVPPAPTFSPNTTKSQTPKKKTNYFEIRKDLPVIPITTEQIVDPLKKSHDFLSEEVTSFADSIDSLFGTERSTDEANKSTVRFSQSALWGEKARPLFNTNLSVDLRLPTLEEKGRELGDMIAGTVENDADSSLADSSQLPVKKKKNPWQFHIQPGIKFSQNMLEITTSGRARKDFVYGKWVHHFYEELTWSSFGVWEEVTSVNSDVIFNKKLLFRFVNDKNWYITSSYMNTHHGPSLIHKINDYSGVSYDLRLNTLLKDGNIWNESYVASFTYSRKIIKNWLIMELNPGIEFPRKNQYNGFSFIGIKFEFIFGNT